MIDKKVIFHDAQREPQVPFNRDHPWGQTIDVTMGREPSCTVELPWPADRCGMFVAECLTCGFTVGLSAAGRVDDPREVKMPCMKRPMSH